MCALAGPVPWPGPPRAPARPRRPSRCACLGSVTSSQELQGGSDRGDATGPPACPHWTWECSARVLGLQLSPAKARLSPASPESWHPVLTPLPSSSRARARCSPRLLCAPLPAGGHLPPASPPGPAGHTGPLHLVRVIGSELGPGGLRCFSLAEFAGLYVLRVGARAVPPGGVQLSVQPDTCHLTASLLSGLRRCPGASRPSPGAGHFQGSPALRAWPGLGALGAWNVDISRKTEAASLHCYLSSRLHAQRGAGTPDPEIRGHGRLHLGQPGGQGFH